MSYLQHLKANLHVAAHAQEDAIAHLIHGLIPAIKIRHHQPTTAYFCEGAFADKALEQLLQKSDVGRQQRYFMLRDDGRILDVKFTAVVAPDKLEVRIV